MRIDKLASAGLIAMVALGVNLQPANANDLTNLLRGHLNNTSWDRGMHPNQALIENNLNQGIQNYNTTIATGVNAGQITPAEEAQLRSELNRIMSMRASYAMGGYTESEVQDLLNTFNNFNSQITAMSQNTATNVAGGGYWGGNYGGPYGSNYANLGGYYGGSTRYDLGYNPNFNYNWGNYDQLTSWRSGLNQRIERARQRGIITSAEAVSMRNEYNDVIRRMNRRTVNGNLRNNHLVRRLESLDRRLNNMIAARGGVRWF